MYDVSFFFGDTQTSNGCTFIQFSVYLRVQTDLPTFYSVFQSAMFKSSIWYETIRNGVVKCSFGFWSTTVSVDSYITRNIHKNSIFAYSNTAFVHCNNYLNKWELKFTTFYCQNSREKICTVVGIMGRNSNR